MLLPAAARAQAFGINEIGTCASSRAFAVTGAPCKDASSIFWNPGAMPEKKGWNLLVGLAAIQIDGKFTQDTTFREYESDVPLTVVPHAFVNYSRPNSKLAYGVGVYVPYGLTSQWMDDFPGRFQAVKASIATIYVQPNVAYQVTPNWSVGLGPVIGHSTVELIQALDLSEQTAAPGVTFAQLGIPRRTEFGRASLEGDAWGFGAHVGVHGRLNPNWTVGLRFLTPVDFEYEEADATFRQTPTGLILPPGNPICSPATRPAFCSSANDIVDVDAELLAPQFAAGGTLVDQGVETKITHPAQIQVGFGFSGFANWLLSADYAWIGWKRFKELPVTFLGPASVTNRILIEDYNHTSAIRLSGQRSFTNGAQLRLGFSGIASAAPDETVTPLLPEQDRVYGSIGGEYPITSSWSIEGGYIRIFTGGRRGRITERGARTQTAAQLNTGVYELNANVFSIGFKGTL